MQKFIIRSLQRIQSSEIPYQQFLKIMKHNCAGKLEEMSHLQIQSGIGVWIEQVERSQNIEPYSEKCNIGDIIYVM